MSFDKIVATYVYCMNYHTGQWSREYRILSKIISQYHLKLTDNAIASIEDIKNCSYDEWFEARARDLFQSSAKVSIMNDGLFKQTIKHEWSNLNNARTSSFKVNSVIK
jgi:hypothetical protein